jgi:transcriptional regulator with XRE-family HTH domain
MGASTALCRSSEQHLNSTPIGYLCQALDILSDSTRGPDQKSRNNGSVPVMPDAGVGRRIRQVRQGLGLTQAGLARQLGVIKVSIARYEAGRVPRANLLDRIATLGGVSVEWLLHGGSSSQRLGAESCRGDRGFRSLSVPMRLQHRVSNLPDRYQERFTARVNELKARLLRELDEYVKLLEAENRVGRMKRKGSPSI